MCVDKTGGDHQPRAIQDFVGGNVSKDAHGDNSAVFDEQVALVNRRARTVRYETALEKCPHCFPLARKNAHRYARTPALPSNDNIRPHKNQYGSLLAESFSVCGACRRHNAPHT